MIMIIIASVVVDLMYIVLLFCYFSCCYYYDQYLLVSSRYFFFFFLNSQHTPTHPHTRMNTRKHTHTRTRTHTYAHTHTYTHITHTQGKSLINWLILEKYSTKRHLARALCERLRDAFYLRQCYPPYYQEFMDTDTLYSFAVRFFWIFRF